MDDAIARFAKAHDAIHDWLDQLLPDSPPHQTFSEAVRAAALVSPGVASHRQELLQFGRLRNFIEHRHHLPLATPTQYSVGRIEQIQRFLCNPPGLIEHFSKEVATCTHETKIGVVTAAMRSGDFSQLPVYQGSQITNMLTTKTIARWFAHTIAVNGGMLEDGKVADALQHAAPESQFEVMGKMATVTQALTSFERHLHDGR